VSSNPIQGEVYYMQHYVIKFVSDLRQVDGFLRLLRFSKTLHRKLKIELHEPNENRGWTQCSECVSSYCSNSDTRHEIYYR
jgi:hypothetical protein